MVMFNHLKKCLNHDNKETLSIPQIANSSYYYTETANLHNAHAFIKMGVTFKLFYNSSTLLSPL